MTEEINDLIACDDKPAKKKKAKAEESEPKKKVRKKKEMTEQEKAVEIQTDDETTRKRDILATTALIDDLEQYVGEKVTAAEVRNMRKERVESLFLVYQEKLGHEMTNGGLATVSDGLIKGLSYFLEFDDVEQMKKDILSNEPLKRTIGRYVSKVVEDYGEVFSIAKCVFDIAKHVVVEKKDDLSEPHSEETYGGTGENNKG